MFTPPLYRQRYQFVKDLVERHQPKKVADLGCASCSLMWTLKFCKCIEELVGLDISETEMKEKMHTLRPLACDYLQPSTRCLSITLYQGSIAEKDPVLLEFDMVAGIELIEHLEEAELKMFPEVVFGFMAPALAVISTPNSEYNHLLPRLIGFRDPDHKFEWKREEFQRWASSAADRYGYTVEFTGVGAPPPDAGDVGHCTQIAVFVRNFTETAKMVDNKRHMPHVYKTVFKAVYPSLQDEKYLQIAVVNETMNQVQRIKRIVGNPEHTMDSESHRQQLNTERKQWPFGKKTAQLTDYTCVSSEIEPNAQTTQIEPFVQKSELYVPLAYLFATPKVKLLCGTFDILVKMVAGKVKLSHDGSAVEVKLDDEQDEYFI